MHFVVKVVCVCVCVHARVWQFIACSSTECCIISHQSRNHFICGLCFVFQGDIGPRGPPGPVGRRGPPVSSVWWEGGGTNCFQYKCGLI